LSQFSTLQEAVILCTLGKQCLLGVQCLLGKQEINRAVVEALVFFIPLVLTHKNSSGAYVLTPKNSRRHGALQLFLYPRFDYGKLFAVLVLAWYILLDHQPSWWPQRSWWCSLN